MKDKRFYAYAACALLITVGLFAANASAQQVNDEKQSDKARSFCSDNTYYASDAEASFREERTTNIPAASLLTVDGKRNGGVRVTGGNRADVLVRACIQTVGDSDEAARASARSVRIATAGGNIRAEGGGDQSNMAVSYEIEVPRSSNLKLTTHNGGISLESVEGSIEFTALNGGIHLRDVAGNVKGRTTNGGVSVALSGSGWKGGGLDVETTNGGVHLSVPQTYAAHIETGTINGGFKSDVGGLSFDRNDDGRGRRSPSRISTDLNGGGAPVRVVTTNGGVKISSSAGKSL